MGSSSKELLITTVPAEFRVTNGLKYPMYDANLTLLDESLVSSNWSFTNGSNMTELRELTLPRPSLVTPFYITVTVSIMYVIVFMLGVTGNAVVIYVVSKHKGMRTATNLFLTNLSTADLLVLLVCMPSSLVEFYAKDVWYLGNAMCKLVPFLENSTVHASILTIIAISVERFYAICWPLKVQFVCTSERTVKIIIGVWAFAFGISCPFIIMSYTENARFFDGTMVIVCRTAIDESWKRAYIVTLSIMFFLLPLLLLIVMYIIIVTKLSIEAKNLGSDSDTSSISNHKIRRQVIMLLVAVIMLFFVCNLPIRALSLWTIFSSIQEKQQLGFEAFLNIIYFARVMFYLNSAGDPIVYNLVSTRFRESCKRIFVGPKPRARKRRSTMIFLFEGHQRKRDNKRNSSSSSFSLLLRQGTCRKNGVPTPARSRTPN